MGMLFRHHPFIHQTSSCQRKRWCANHRLTLGFTTWSCAKALPKDARAFHGTPRWAIAFPQRSFGYAKHLASEVGVIKHVWCVYHKEKNASGLGEGTYV